MLSDEDEKEIRVLVAQADLQGHHNPVLHRDTLVDTVEDCSL